MSIVKSGPMMGHSGTVDGITYCVQPDGTTTAKRKNSASTKPNTKSQDSVNSDSGIFAKFMKPLKGFVNVSYALEAKLLNLSPYNTMVKYVRKAAIQGQYPNRYIDFSKVMMTKGSLPSSSEASAEMTNSGLDFTWSTELLPKMTHYSDQVIMLAYFPDLEEVRYMAGAAYRSSGKDHLMLQGVKKGNTAHVYISFITDDHSRIADSTYLGQFNW
ncbi:MAG: DUF6266 family protein [Pedobacter sp.]|uniref:DUF6266 family protein n=1 Tax=Pedobacter sp. TaxID=1411316 RepID=UPI003392CA4F